jgi:hypothetical protein
LLHVVVAAAKKEKEGRETVSPLLQGALLLLLGFPPERL